MRFLGILILGSAMIMMLIEVGAKPAATPEETTIDPKETAAADTAAVEEVNYLLLRKV